MEFKEMGGWKTAESKNRKTELYTHQAQDT